jgi:hypothetical protein
MKPNTQLETMLTEAGNLLNIKTNDIQAVLKTKKKIIACLMVACAGIFITNLFYGPSRYGAVTMQEFLHFWKFLYF